MMLKHCGHETCSKICRRSFVKFSPCKRINLFLPYQSLQNLFLSYVKVI
ncbi:hypothetical protein HanHA300_Chr09g0311221 [Helianthus annuus]|nr:hypothetical protein HanHA300_Chr09g0311221 [Helianthus annuus]